MKKKGLIFKKWWFWVIVILVIGLVAGLIIINSPKINIPPVIPPVSPPISPPVINNTVPNNTSPPPVIPPVVTPGTNVSFGKNLRLTIKAANPQYKSGQDVTLLYTLENTGNKTISITPDVVNGVKVKNPGGKTLDYNGTSGGVKVITESFTLEVGKKSSGSITIKAGDYDFFTIGNNADGYFNTISAYVGDVESNRIIPRFLKY
jgi:hypothetical protein